MIIYFNTEWDGAPWNDQSASLGTLKTGPLGLLSVLETRCGTTGVRRSDAARVAGMMTTLSAIANTPALNEANGAWFRSSFASDSWATAADLLALRDELLTARIGDSPAPASSRAETFSRRRLEMLTALAEAAEAPGDGIPDRIQDTVGELRSAEFGNLKPLADYRIVVVEPEALLPPVWRIVLAAFSDAGGVVEYRGDRSTDASPPESPESPEPRLTVIRAQDEWQAAEHLAAVLSHLKDSDPSVAGSLALVVPGDADALDWTLERWGLPVTGRSGESAARWGLQILPAFLATLWSPADPRAIAAFLALASGLVPAVVSRELIHALSEHPGTGGKKWNEALEKIVNATDNDTAEFYDRLFARELFPPDEGVPVSVLTERVVWLQRRLAAKVDQRKTVRFALGHIVELRDIGGLLSSDPGYRIPQALLDRIVGTVIHPVSAGREEEAAPWSVHRSLATVPASTRTVIYWNCSEAEPAVAQRFTETERELLADGGFLLESPETVRARREWNRLRALSVPDRQIVALVPDRIRGEETEPAAWLAELQSNLGDVVETRDLSDGQFALDIAGVTVSRARQDTAPVIPQEVAAVHQVPPGVIAYPEKLSYSGIQSLIGCPMQWTLGRITQLWAASNVSLPSGNQMIGTLTHKIIERIAREHAPEGVLPENSAEIAASLFDELVPAMAAELLQPGRGLTRRRYREAVITAVTALREVLRRLKLTITRVETYLKASWELSVDSDGTTTTVCFRGPADMELADAQGNPFVLDLKYSYADKYYTELVSGGEALQLASYAWLIEQHSGKRAVGSGYFLLPTRTLITDSLQAGADAVESDRSLSEIWRRGERSVTQGLRRLHTEGIIDVTGVQEAEGEEAVALRRQTMEESGGLYVKPPCRFCDYQIICGLGRGQI